MKRSWLSLLESLAIIAMVAACTDGRVRTGTDEPVAVNDGDTAPESDDLVAVPEEDATAENALPVDEDLLPEENCSQGSEPKPVDTGRVIRLTHQWGGEGMKSLDIGKAIAVDPSGNIYIAGSTDAYFNCHQNRGGDDLVLMKITGNGTLLWTRQWGTEEDDWVRAMAIDAERNLFVAGVTAGSLGDNADFAGGYKDIFVTKWTSAGVELWTKQWGTEWQDFVRGMTLDSEGNVLLAGSVNNSILLAKWDADGNEIWTVQWGEEATGYGSAVAVAPNGDILVAGGTDGDLDGNTNAGGRCNCMEFPPGSGMVGCADCHDIFLSRFTADGVRIDTVQWGLYDAEDIPEEIFVADDGSVFIAGTTQGSFEGNVNAGGSCGYDYCSDVFLSRLDMAGQILWTRQWGEIGDDSLGGLDGYASGLIVAGGATLAEYDFDGAALWTADIGTTVPADLIRSYDGTIAVTGYEIMTAGSNYDLFAGIWDSTGTAGWSALFYGNNAADQATALAIDSGGNIFVAGSTDGSIHGNTTAGGIDIFLTKWLPDGTRAWSRQMGSAAYDIGNSIAIDAANVIFMTGYTGGVLHGNITNAGGYDVFLSKWDGDGEREWTREWGTSEEDSGHAVAIDKEGNIFVAGYTDGSIDGQTPAGEVNMFLAKFNNSGTKVWTRQWGSDSFSLEASKGIAVDIAGNVFVTGYTDGELDGNTNAGAACVMCSGMHITQCFHISCKDAFLTKFSPDGTKVWTKQWGTKYNDVGNAVAVDGAGNIYVTGKTGDYTDSQTSPLTILGDQNMVLTKWRSDGTQEWSKQWGSSAMEEGTGVAVSSSGAVFVTGYTSGALDENQSRGGYDIFLVKVDGTGTQLWAEQWGSGLNDYGNAVAIDPDDRIFVVGATSSAFDGNLSMGGTDAFLSIIEEK